ncbi:ROK family transcriptional regulator [Streptomyces sp. NPDC051211]|uniref:ROK family transcriptional regulator n=1 Tax=Streptomyces sp. NPDC051211 TaxID=3154643 RepID=UPI00344C9242
MTHAGDDRAAVNAAAVLRTVLDHGPVARSVISRLCGLSPAAVSRQTTGLIRRGLLRELREPPGPAASGGIGRPRIPLDLHTGAVGGAVAAGLHIGVPASTFGLVDLRGQVLARRTFPHDGGHSPARIGAELARFLAEFAGGRPLLGAGAALGGRVRPDDGVVVRHEALGWRDRPLARELSEVLGLPVRVDNHARAVAGAEILFGRPEARRSLVHLFIGNVVDAAFGIEGALHRGPNAAAGEVAHLPVPGSTVPCAACGRTGCLQATASDAAVCAEAVRRRIVPDPAIWLLVDAAAAGDPRADRLLRERARAVGRAAALLLDVFDPAVMVVTELSSVLHEGYLDEIREAAVALSHVCADPERIVGPHAGPAVLPEAAAAVLLGPLFSDPSASSGPSVPPDPSVVT